MEYKVKGRVQRGIRRAYVNTMAKGSTKNGGIWPFDTGTLKHSFRMNLNGDYYTLTFDDGNMNYKSKQQLSKYIKYIDPNNGSPTSNARNGGWWDNVCNTFMNELANITNGNLKKK